MHCAQSASSFIYATSCPCTTCTRRLNSLHYVDVTCHVQAQAQEVHKQLEACQAQEEDAVSKAELQAQLAKLQTEKEQLQQKKADLEVVDPSRYAALVEGIEVCRQAANRWMDNISNIIDWCKKQFQGRDGDIDEVFKDCGWSENIDYIAATKV